MYISEQVTLLVIIGLHLIIPKYHDTNPILDDNEVETTLGEGSSNSLTFWGNREFALDCCTLLYWFLTKGVLVIESVTEKSFLFLQKL